MASLAKLSVTLQILALVTMLAAVLAQQATAKTHHLYWTVENATLTRNCQTVTVATVNGMSPGPIVEVDEGDTLVITVTNKQVYPVTMHWHGINQMGTNYADGPAYITQCPIKEGDSYIYQFTIDNQRGTFWYHAHINWLRATVHGALIVKPKVKPPYGRVEAEIPIILGEWFGINPNVYELGFVNTLDPIQNITTVTPTINGNPGPFYNCSKGPELFKLEPNKTYLLRIIDAVMNDDTHFRVAGHKLTVVAADGNYLKPFKTQMLALTPGQTTDVLLTTSQTPGKYYFGINPGPIPNLALVTPPQIPALGVFEYTNAPASATPVVPKFPNNVTVKPTNKYVTKLKNYGKYELSKTVDQDLIYTVTVAAVACEAPEPCVLKVMGALQNITFDDPKDTSILQAYASGANGVYEPNFPDKPPPELHLNTTGSDLSYLTGSRGTRVKVLNYGDTVQLVLQNVFTTGILDHPFHLHGHDFYVVGRGYGVYNPDKDQASFNLVDPPMVNTFGLPNGGWLAIRFHANNPGVWLLHCHFERHVSWGMMMAFITKNGGSHTLKGPLHPLPKCT